MIDKRLDDIAADDLRQLVDDRVQEGRSLEYKEHLPGRTDSERKEFLADVSSFANAVGGDLIYGVSEARDGGRPTGVPSAIVGVELSNADAEILRLENVLRTGVGPRIAGVRFRRLEGFERGPALIIRVPRSWAGPHMATFQHHSRFYSRQSAGKYPLDVIELRTAFLNSGSLSERAREFRTERLGRLVAAETPARMTSASLICVHAIPHASLAGVVSIEPRDVAGQDAPLSPFYGDGHGGRFNIDGYLTLSPTSDGRCVSYVRVYRTGIVETVNSSMLQGSPDEPISIPARTFAEELFSFIRRVLDLYRGLEVEPPVSICVSLLGVMGHQLGVNIPGTIGGDIGLRPMDRDILILPEITVSGLDDQEVFLLRPVLDALWQSAGLPSCRYYDEAGNWTPP